MVIHIAKSDITEMAVDAVVNPANSLGIMGGGVAAALSRKGGPTIQREAMSLAPIAVGAAVVTNAGQLWAKHVIHAPDHGRAGHEDRGRERAPGDPGRADRGRAPRPRDHRPARAWAPASAGVDPADAARAMVDELRAHRQPKPTTVYLVDLNDNILRRLEEALRLATG